MPETSVQILSGQDVFTHFADPDFRSQWTNLHENCAWATSMQSLAFVEPWYACYNSLYKPLIVIERNLENAELIGLLPLAIETESSRLVVAGDHLCEYSTWLATAQNGDQFIVKALNALAQKFPNAVLNFLFLAAGSPLGWLETDKDWNQKCDLRKIERPLLELNDGAELQAILDRKKTRTRLKQMARAGAIEFVKVAQPDELNDIFDEVQTFSDLRLSAVHRVSPSHDPLKKKFYLELLKANLLHATLLKVGDKIASAHFNLHNRDQVLLGLTAFSPFFAKHSPSKFHVTMLGLELIKENVKTCDLTPGGNYKEGHANAHDQVHVLTVYFNQSSYRKFKVKRQLIETTKKGLVAIKIDRAQLIERLDNVRHKLKFVTAKNVFPLLAARAFGQRAKKKEREMRIYTFDVEKIRDLPNPNLMNCDCLSDLLKYEPSEAWQLTPSEFHSLAIERLSEGNHVYTKVESGKLVHCGWLIERQEKSFIAEVNQFFEMKPDSAVLFDFFTHTAARGKGFYQAAMRQMLHDASRIPNTRQVYISVLADNVPSRRAIEKIGFEYECSLFG